MLESARVGHLGFLDERDHPRVLPVTFVLHRSFVYSAIDEKPKRVPASEVARIRYLRRRPQAALTVDRYDDEWSDLAWVQVLGRVDVLDAHEDRAGVEALQAKYEPYRHKQPPGPLLRLTPERTLCWRASG